MLVSLQVPSATNQDIDDEDDDLPHLKRGELIAIVTVCVALVIMLSLGVVIYKLRLSQKSRRKW